jgi:hypothetical protein
VSVLLSPSAYSITGTPASQFREYGNRGLQCLPSPSISRMPCVSSVSEYLGQGLCEMSYLHCRNLGNSSYNQIRVIRTLWRANRWRRAEWFVELERGRSQWMQGIVHLQCRGSWWEGEQLVFVKERKKEPNSFIPNVLCSSYISFEILLWGLTTYRMAWLLGCGFQDQFSELGCMVTNLHHHKQTSRRSNTSCWGIDQRQKRSESHRRFARLEFSFHVSQ